jgi:hypothetical protein
MKIILEESGGYLGMDLPPKIIDTDNSTMSNDDIKRLDTLIQESNFFALPSFLPTSSAEHESAADYKSYKITINGNKGNHSIMFSDISKKENKAFSDLIKFVKTHVTDTSK